MKHLPIYYAMAFMLGTVLTAEYVTVCSPGSSKTSKFLGLIHLMHLLNWKYDAEDESSPTLRDDNFRCSFE